MTQSKTKNSRRKFSPAALADRRKRFMPGGIPKWVRCYDNGGKTIDRYSVVFTGRYGHLTGNETWVVHMSASPFHPQGVGMHASCPHNERPDTSNFGWPPAMGRKCWLGKRIPFEELPEDCRKLVIQDYKYLWSLTTKVPLYAHDPFAGCAEGKDGNIK